eukprot:TRINITY_DN11362_c0_g1_i1.p1 TRINITY_DN11362_c0_g1~~TRINITY_DN11362_c0_g1_i1.p1  ORF type:complete len:392 (+),score=92.85 TRINITY_DN11362_c0_g1_i1:84-1259(+)
MAVTTDFHRGIMVAAGAVASPPGFLGFGAEQRCWRHLGQRGPVTVPLAALVTGCEVEQRLQPEHLLIVEEPEESNRHGDGGMNSGADEFIPAAKQRSFADFENPEELGQGCAQALLRSLQGQVLRMALDARGCRVIQRALELADDQSQVALARELHGHVCEALESPHANHVLQRAIELMRPTSVHFVLIELQAWGRPAALARHRYGCRVLERLIEHFPMKSLGVFLDEILAESHELSRHVYGNFVVQHVVEHGDQNHRRQIVEMLLKDLMGAALDQHACSVLDKALSYGSHEDQCRLAEQVLRAEGLLATMANLRGGFAATQRLFKARSQIKLRANDIARTKHGRALVAAILPELAPVLPGVMPSPSRANARGFSRQSSAPASSGPRGREM